MAIEILRRGTRHLEKKIIICGCCDSELRYDKNDVQVVAEDRPCGSYQEFLICPVCENKLTLCIYDGPV